MAVMDYMLSDEGMMLLNYGIENRHYKIENDKVVSLLPINESTGFQKDLYDSDVAPGVYRIKGLLSWYRVLPDEFKYRDEQIQIMNAWGNSPYLKLDELEYVSVDSSFGLKISELEESVNVAYREIIRKINGNVEETREDIWNEFVTRYRKSGDAYINEKNKRAQELFGK